MKKVLVTGAYGFLGKYILEELLINGYKVVAFGRKKEELDKLKKDNLEIFIGDFINKEDIINASKNVDYIVHAGALSTVWGKREDFINTNVESTKNIIEACKKNNIKKLIYISSPSIYTSNKDKFDILEKDFDNSNKLNYYIESKILAEEEIKKSKKLNYIILRPRGLFGVGDTSIIPRLIKANNKIGIPLFNNGKNIVDMTCVENVALAIRLAIQSEKAKNNIYNITNGEPKEFKLILEELFESLNEKPKYLNISLKVMYSISCIIELIYKLLQIYKEPIITKYTILTLGHSQTLNIDSAKKDLKYVPKITLSEGIKKYAKEYTKG